MSVFVIIFLILGLFFGFVGALGVVRMPDVFGRLQASTCLATLSTICIGLAGVLYAASRGMGVGTVVKLVIFVVMILLTNPISNHALCKAAYHMGIRPEKGFVIDDYGTDFFDANPEEPVTEEVPEAAENVTSDAPETPAEEGKEEA